MDVDAYLPTVTTTARSKAFASSFGTRPKRVRPVANAKLMDIGTCCVKKLFYSILGIVRFEESAPEKNQR